MFIRSIHSKELSTPESEIINSKFSICSSSIRFRRLSPSTRSEHDCCITVQATVSSTIWISYGKITIKAGLWFCRYDAARVMYGLTNCVRCQCGDDLSLVSADQFGSYIEIPGGDIRVPLGYVGVLAPLLRDLPDCCVKLVREKHERSESSAEWTAINTGWIFDGERSVVVFSGIANQLSAFDGVQQAIRVPELSSNATTAMNCPLTTLSSQSHSASWNNNMRNYSVPIYPPRRSRRSTNSATDTLTRSS